MNHLETGAKLRWNGVVSQWGSRALLLHLVVSFSFMGAASSVALQAEKEKPLDASDIHSTEEAKAEITRLRTLLHDVAKDAPNETAVSNHTNTSVSTISEPVLTDIKPVDVANETANPAKSEEKPDVVNEMAAPVVAPTVPMKEPKGKYD
jgi:hypothetical protein